MQRRSAFFATCPPGLARLLRDRLAAVAGVTITASGSDGQADYVLFEADRSGRASARGLRLADGVFAAAGQARRDGSTDPASVAARCWQRDGVQRALSLWAEQYRPLSPAMTFRVAARMQTGPRLLRAGLRDALAGAVRRDRPRWRPSGQGELEIWLSEWRDGELITGLRLGGNRPGRDGLAREAVPSPALAAAMVQLAGEPGILLDPCCGTGTVLAEALAAGWMAEGTESDPELAAAARAAGAKVAEGHAHEILEPDATVDACVSRLRPGTGDRELAAALAEMSRVTRGGGAVVLLASDLPRAVMPAALRLRQQVPVRLPSGRETIWVFRRP